LDKKRRHRILLGKVGLDGHTTGLYTVSKGLSDAGFEVIFGGIRLTTKQMSNIALQEEVDAIGLSILSGAHLTLAHNLLRSLKEMGLQDLPVVIGGIVPPEDISKLRKLGVRDVFIPGTFMTEIVSRLKKILDAPDFDN